MAAVVLRHNPLVVRTVMPLALVLVLGLVAIGVLGALSPWIFDAGLRNPMLPVWVKVVLGIGFAAFFGKYLLDTWRTRHAYFERLTLDDAGINVESDSEASFYVAWSDVVSVDSPQPFIVRVNVHGRSRPICLVNNGWAGFSPEFQAAKALVYGHAST